MPSRLLNCAAAALIASSVAACSGDVGGGNTGGLPSSNGGSGVAGAITSIIGPSGAAGEEPSASDAAAMPALPEAATADAVSDRPAADGLSDAGSELGASSPVQCSQLRFCEDFEAQPLGKGIGKPWTNTSLNGGEISVEETNVFSGKRALHVRAPVADAPAGLINTSQPFPIAGNNMFGRMMVYFSGTQSVHWDMIEATDNGNIFYRYGGQGTTWLANYIPNDCYRHSKSAPPVGRWVCVEWQFDGSPEGAATKDELRLWIDGVAISDVTVSKQAEGCGTRRWVAPAFQKLSLGVKHNGATSAAVDMFIDDIAVDTKPIGCPAR